MLRPLADVSPADWFVDADADWGALVGLGPPGFEAYVRVLYALDEEAPADAGQQTRAAVREILVRHTATPQEWFFGLWDGWGGDINELAEPGRHEKFSVPNRDFYLFSGSPAETPTALLNARYGVGDGPHLEWPADHAWFVASDVDPDWFGVGGSRALIDELLADSRLDVVPATYGPDQPETR